MSDDFMTNGKESISYVGVERKKGGGVLMSQTTSLSVLLYSFSNDYKSRFCIQQCT